MFCSFINIGHHTFQCSKCGTIIETEAEPPIFPCSAINISSNEIGFVQKIKNFSDSLLNHAKNNFIMADDSEIEKRFKICEGCDYFSNGSCSQCGCPIHRTKNYISKLSWTSEKCPIDKW
jgi:uncharacterized paraquat-inducible protein A